MHGALLVKEALPAAGSEHAFVPDAGVDVQALVAGKAEADESLGRDVITRQGQRDVKGLAVQREEELTAVRVVIGMPKQHAAGLTAMIVAGLWRVGGVRQDVVPGDRFILPVKNVALPIADENALRGAGFIAGVFVHGPGARRGPANNLDGAKFRVIDQMTVALEAAVSGVDDGHDDRRQTAWNVRVEEVEYRHNLVILSRGRPIPPTCGSGRRPHQNNMRPRRRTLLRGRLSVGLGIARDASYRRESPYSGSRSCPRTTKIRICPSVTG